ncbi:MAG: hypothetical protein IPK16_09640 [Anaerolineales bacterium]|nr:hypothetical protein [Anaerolineales bacterium]
MVQNNDELRATGGFISAFGLITVDQARSPPPTLPDSYTEMVPYPRRRRRCAGTWASNC